MLAVGALSVLVSDQLWSVGLPFSCLVPWRRMAFTLRERPFDTQAGARDTLRALELNNNLIYRLDDVGVLVKHVPQLEERAHPDPHGETLQLVASTLREQLPKYERHFAESQAALPHLQTVLPSGVIENDKALEPKAEKGLICYPYPQSMKPGAYDERGFLTDLSGTLVGDEPTPIS